MLHKSLIIIPYPCLLFQISRLQTKKRKSKSFTKILKFLSFTSEIFYKIIYHKEYQSIN